MEAGFISLVNLRDLKLVLLELFNQLSGIQLAVASSSFDDLRLLLQSKVFPRKIWSNVLLKQAEDLVVRNSTWVGEVVDTGVLVLGQDDRSWEEIVEDCVGIGNIDYALVFGDLGDEVTGVQVIADGHPKSEDESIAVELHDLRKS